MIRLSMRNISLCIIAVLILSVSCREVLGANCLEYMGDPTKMKTGCNIDNGCAVYRTLKRPDEPICQHYSPTRFEFFHMIDPRGCSLRTTAEECLDLNKKSDEMTCGWCVDKKQGGACLPGNADSPMLKPNDPSFPENLGAFSCPRAEVESGTRIWDGVGCSIYKNADQCFRVSKDNNQACGFCKDKHSKDEGFCIPRIPKEQSLLPPNVCDFDWDFNGCMVNDNLEDCQEFAKSNQGRFLDDTTCGWCGENENKGMCTSGTESDSIGRKCEDVWDVFGCMNMNKKMDIKNCHSVQDGRGRQACGWCAEPRDNANPKPEVSGLCFPIIRSEDLEFEEGDSSIPQNRHCANVKKGNVKKGWMWDVEGCGIALSSEACHTRRVEGDELHRCGWCGTGPDEGQGQCRPASRQVPKSIKESEFGELNGPECQNDDKTLFWDMDACMSMGGNGAKCSDYTLEDPGDGQPMRFKHFCDWDTTSEKCLSIPSIDSEKTYPWDWNWTYMITEDYLGSVDEITPTRINRIGDHKITIRGKNIGVDADSVKVEISWVKCRVVSFKVIGDSDSFHEVVCVTTEGRNTGEAKVTVKNTFFDEELHIEKNEVYFYDPPVITAIEPSTLNCLGTQEVTITGNNLGTVGQMEKLKIGSADCQDIRYLEDQKKVACSLQPFPDEIRDEYCNKKRDLDVEISTVVQGDKGGQGVCQAKKPQMSDKRPKEPVLKGVKFDASYVRLSIEFDKSDKMRLATGYILEKSLKNDFSQVETDEVNGVDPDKGDHVIGYAGISGATGQVVFFRVKGKNSFGSGYPSKAFSIIQEAPKCDGPDCLGHGVCRPEDEGGDKGQCNCDFLHWGEQCDKVVDRACPEAWDLATYKMYCETCFGVQPDPPKKGGGVESITKACSAARQEFSDMQAIPCDDECKHKLLKYTCLKHLPPCHDALERAPCINTCKAAANVAKQHKERPGEPSYIDCGPFEKETKNCYAPSGFTSKDINDPGKKKTDLTWLVITAAVIGGLIALVVVVVLVVFLCVFVMKATAGNSYRIAGKNHGDNGYVRFRAEDPDPEAGAATRSGSFPSAAVSSSATPVVSGGAVRQEDEDDEAARERRRAERRARRESKRQAEIQSASEAVDSPAMAQETSGMEQSDADEERRRRKEERRRKREAKRRAEAEAASAGQVAESPRDNPWGL